MTDEEGLPKTISNNDTVNILARIGNLRAIHGETFWVEFNRSENHGVCQMQ